MPFGILMGFIINYIIIYLYWVLIFLFFVNFILPILIFKFCILILNQNCLINHVGGKVDNIILLNPIMSNDDNNS